MRRLCTPGGHWLVMVLVSLGSGCSVFDDGKVKGELSSSGGDLEAWTMIEGKCYSGQRENYFGVVMFDKTDKRRAVKLIKDPVAGYAVTINIPSTCVDQQGCRAIVLKASDCATLDADVRNTNTTVNDIRKVDGHLALDCALGDEARLTGRLNFTGCH